MLLLIPTATERDILLPHLDVAHEVFTSVELCGFGSIAAAARTAELIHKVKPTRIVLAGIAGTYDSDTTFGAYWFASVRCHGIGVGEGRHHVDADELGWQQFPSVAGTLQVTVPEETKSRTLLSVCAASANAKEASHRKLRYPDAVSEDMEGYGVALACQIAGIPLSIVRGISNVAGDRDKANWSIPKALASVGELLNGMEG